MTVTFRLSERTYGGSGSCVDCGRSSGGTFSRKTPHPSSALVPSASVVAAVAVAAVSSFAPSPPSSHLISSTPASHCELNDDGAGEPLPAESESGGEDDTEPVLCTLSPHTAWGGNATVMGDGVRACTVVIECECAWRTRNCDCAVGVVVGDGASRTRAAIDAAAAAAAAWKRGG